MRWTRAVATMAGLLVLAGCGYGYGFRMAAVSPRYSTDSRPDGSYFCYDCHGYRYFDPYYDYCDGNGFRYRWADHPRVMAIYRDRYVRIRERHPDYGRYRYREGYRASQRYREPADYERWRGEKPAPQPPDVGRDRRVKDQDEVGRDRKVKDRERDGRDQGTKKKSKGEKRKGPRDSASRLTLPGGES
jgi:hypothetical protein